MSVTSFYPVLMSRDVANAANFYRDVFGFETVFEVDWYASLRLGTFELALLAYEHPTVPEGYCKLPQGVIVNIEVEDANKTHSQVVETLGVPVVLPLRDEDFGQRHFIITGPDDVLIDVIEPIEPSEEYAKAYMSE